MLALGTLPGSKAFTGIFPAPGEDSICEVPCKAQSPVLEPKSIRATTVIVYEPIVLSGRNPFVGTRY